MFNVQTASEMYIIEEILLKMNVFLCELLLVFDSRSKFEQYASSRTLFHYLTH